MAPCSAMVISAVALCRLGTLLPGDAAEVCTDPAGSIGQHRPENCTPGTKRCFLWTNATCSKRNKCECQPDQCVMQGQCVSTGKYATVTGGTCAIQKCDSWRNAICSETTFGLGEGRCVCGPGTRPIKGECRPPGTCAKSTGGTCNFLPCAAWRRAECSVSGLPQVKEISKCMCGAGACPIRGECVADRGCPRFTGSHCATYLVLGLHPCKAGTCTKYRDCACRVGECFVNGKCEPKTKEIIKLSRAQGREQEGLESGGGAPEELEEVPQVSMAVSVFVAFAALFSLSAASAALDWGRRAQASGPEPEAYNRLEC